MKEVVIPIWYGFTNPTILSTHENDVALIELILDAKNTAFDAVKLWHAGTQYVELVILAP